MPLPPNILYTRVHNKIGIGGYATPHVNVLPSKCTISKPRKGRIKRRGYATPDALTMDIEIRVLTCAKFTSTVTVQRD